MTPPSNLSLATSQEPLITGQLLTLICHEMHQPLHAYGLFSDELAVELKDSRVSEALSEMGQAIVALQRCIETLHDAARLDSGKITPRLALVPVHSVFEQLEEHFPDLDCVSSDLWVKTDSALLARLLGHLVENVGGTASVRCTSKSGQAAFEVSCSADLQERGSQRKGLRSGAYLGLGVAHRLASLMGVAIEQTFAQTGKTAYVVGVPLAEAQRETPSGPDFMRGLKVVVAIEDRTTSVLMRGLINSWGGALIQPVQEGVAPEQVDLLVVGAGSQDLVDALVNLRATYGNVPAICLGSPPQSTLGDTEAVICLPAPVTPPRLRMAISRLMGRLDSLGLGLADN